jgi:uncharacterized protein (TIGR02265 family)
MILRRFTTHLDAPLRGTIDPEQRVAQAVKAVTVKGMFLAPHADAIGDRWPEVARKLLNPPRDGRYVPFNDYPLADYYRVVFAGAAQAFPALPLPEACRQASRHHMQAFAASTVGRVMLAMISDAHGALLALPNMFARGSSGIVVKAQAEGAGVRVEMQNIGGVQDCSAIGTLEGCVLYYGGKPTLDVDLVARNRAVYLITWS